MNARSLAALRRSAARATNARGHRMQWTMYYGGAETVAHAFGTGQCRDCGAQAVLDTRPAANGADVCGDAVAVACRVSIVRGAFWRDTVTGECARSTEFSARGWNIYADRFEPMDEGVYYFRNGRADGGQ